MKLNCISTKMGLIFMGFAILVLVSVGAMYWGLYAQKVDAVVINLAGRRRALIQQMTRLTLEIQNQELDEHIALFQESQSIFEQTLIALRDGGPAPYFAGSSISLPRIVSPTILQQIDQVEHTWQSFQEQIALIESAPPASEEFKQAVKSVENISVTFVAEADQLVRLLEAQSIASVRTLRWVQIIFLICALVLSIIGLWITYRYVLFPLRELGSAARGIGSGNLDATVQDTGDEENELEYKLMRHRRNYGHLLILVVFVLLAATIASCSSRHTQSRTSPPQFTVLPRENRPNIILIMADDLDLRLGTLDTMPNLNKLLVEEGLSFENFYVTNSLCCPSRSTILRGQYTHNHEIFTNIFPTGGFEKFHRTDLEPSTSAVWLQSAGYRTVLLGKYLNGYPMRSNLLHIPPGWSEWYSPIKGKPYSGFNYTMNENGKPVRYAEAPEDYLTDVIVRKTIDFIHRASGDKVPFFVYFSTYNPHEPPKAAYRHRGLFHEARAPQTPSFNEADVTDKPDGIRFNPLLTDEDIIKLNELYIERLQSMQAVDEMIPQVIKTLEDTGTLENTYIIFTSDNGYHLGQHRLKNGKATAYLEDIQVPFIVRGPGIPAGQLVQGYVASNIDFAPTFADLAGVVPPEFIDGRSLTPLFPNERLAEDSWRQAILLEYYRAGNQGTKSKSGFIDKLRDLVRDDLSGVLEPPDGPLEQGPEKLDPAYRGLITPCYKYVQYDDGFIELYDLQADPYELENISSTADPALLRKFSIWLDRLVACAGSTCREADLSPP